MGRKPELPRLEIDGKRCIELYRSQPLRKLEVDDAPTRDVLSSAVSKFSENMDLVQRFFIMQTGEELHVIEDGDDFVWCVVETRNSSAANKSLATKAKRFEQLVVTRTNEYINTIKDAHYATTDKTSSSVSEGREQDRADSGSD